jgi:hypothetical protein
VKRTDADGSLTVRGFYGDYTLAGTKFCISPEQKTATVAVSVPTTTRRDGN